MIIGAVALPVFFLLTFAVPAGTSPGMAATWVVVAFLLAATCFSLFQVPYIALPAELSGEYDVRTRLLTSRVAVMSLAILLFGAGGPMLRSVGDPYTGYLIMALVAGLVIAAGLLVATTVAPRGMPSGSVAVVKPVETDESPIQPGSTPTGSTGAGQQPSWASGYRDGFGALRRSAPFRALLGAFVLQAVATGLMLAGANYVAVWVMHSDDALTFLFAALIAPAIIFSPVWNVVARRIGKERGFVIASVLFAGATGTLTAAAWVPGPWMYASVAVAGAAYAGMQALPMAMLPDVVSHDARTNGPGRAGVFGGVWTAGETTGMALGAGVLALILTVTGYVQTVANVTVDQPATAVQGIAVGFSAVPAALTLISLVFLARYRLRRDDVDAPAADGPATEGIS